MKLAQHALRAYVGLVGLAALVPVASAVPADDGGFTVPVPGVLGLLAVGGVAAAAAMWRSRRK